MYPFATGAGPIIAPGPASASAPGYLDPTGNPQQIGGFKLYIVPHTDSAAETLAGWRLDEDTSSILEFLNASSTNAKFIPMIRGTQSGTDEGLHIRGASTTDSGTTPIVVFGARIGTGTDVATRPLFSWRNNGTELMSMSAGGVLTLTRAAVASNSETILSLRVSDTSTNGFDFQNISAADATMSPQLLMTGSTTNTGVLKSSQGTDSGGNHIFAINCTIGANTSVATRPLYALRNNGTNMFEVSAKGAVTETITHTDSSAETLHTWKLDEDGSSSLTIINGTSANATFNPFIVGTQSAATLALGFQAKGTTDSGSVALMEWDSRIGASTAVATRSPFVWYNNGTEVMSLTGTTAGSALKTSGGRIRKVRVALTTPVTVATTDDIVQIKLTTPGAVAVSLPASPEAGREYTIQDATGDAGANNITITPAAGNINGAGTLVMNVNYQRKVLQYDSSATAQWLAG